MHDTDSFESNGFDFRSVGGVLIAKVDLLTGAATPIWDFGWADKPDEVAAVARHQPFATAAATPAGRVAEDVLPKEVYQWHAYRALFGRNPPGKNQKDVGSCVGFGTNTAGERGYAIDIKTAGGGADQFFHFVEEVTYGGSRYEVGGGRIRGDGSVGAWAAQFLKEWGVLPRGVHGQYDLTTYNTTTCRSFGRDGVPDNLEPSVREYPVADVVPVRSWIEAKKLLAQGYGISVCSDQGFSMRRDSRGVAAASGSWAHCMALDGYQIVTEGMEEYGHIENSWSETAHTGPVGWGEPSSAGFWASSKIIDRMLRQGETWAYSKVRGFPARKIDWRLVA